MPKIKQSPKHNPGKFRTHLAQAVKHLELARTEHNKLLTTSPSTEDGNDAAVDIHHDLDHASEQLDSAMRQYVHRLRPTLPGYIEVSDEGEMEDEG